MNSSSSHQGTLQICLSDAWGGLEMVAFEVAQKMKANGHFVTTVCPPGSPLERNLRQAGLDTLTVQRRSKYFCWECVRTLRQALKTGRYSAVLIEQMNELWQVVPALWRMPHIRLVGISHTFLAIQKKDWLHRILYRRMNPLIALTEIHRQNLIEQLPVEPEAVAVLPNAVDSEKFNPKHRREEFRQEFLRSADEILIGVVSRLDFGKGVMEVVRVADRLQKWGIPFRLILVGNETAGESGAKAQLEQGITRCGLQERVVLLGHRSDISTIIASLDVLLMPSPVETFGRVLIEAMASGVAVVASSGGGVPNIVKNEQNGLLVPALDAEQMANGIARLYREPQLRARLALTGMTHARERYNDRALDLKLYRMLGLA